MAHDPILHLLGLAKKAGRLEIGEEPVGGVCRARQAKLMLIASDAAPNTRRRAAHFGEAGNVLWLELPFTKGELGFALGRTSCAMLALTDAGFSASIAEKLVARDPERYTAAAQQLRTKADRVLQRQREKRQHEKNLREGKRKPWAVPQPLKQEEQEKPRAPRPPKARTPQKGVNRRTAPHQTRSHGSGRPQERGAAGSKQRSGAPSAPRPMGGKKLTGKVRKHP